MFRGGAEWIATPTVGLAWCLQQEPRVSLPQAHWKVVGKDRALRLWRGRWQQEGAHGRRRLGSGWSGRELQHGTHTAEAPLPFSAAACVYILFACAYMLLLTGCKRLAAVLLPSAPAHSNLQRPSVPPTDRVQQGMQLGGSTSSRAPRRRHRNASHPNNALLRLCPRCRIKHNRLQLLRCGCLSSHAERCLLVKHRAAAPGWPALKQKRRPPAWLRQHECHIWLQLSGCLAAAAQAIATHNVD